MRYILSLFLILFALQEALSQNNPGKEFPFRYNLPLTLHPVNPNNRAYPDFSHVTDVLQFFENNALFDHTSLNQFNQVGSFGYFRNGIEASIHTANYRCLVNYTYLNWDGYRQHNNAWGSIVDFYLASKISERSHIRVLGSYIDGMVKMPGSLTLQEYSADRFAADPRSVNRDEKRISQKGRLDISWDTKFGRKLNNEFYITGTGRIEAFVRTTEEYKLINKVGLGLVAGYRNKTSFLRWQNQVTAGIEVFTESIKTAYFENFAGEQGDLLEQLHREKLGNQAIFLTDKFGTRDDQISILLSGRFDRENYLIAEQIIPSRADTRRFQAFTPMLQLQYNEAPWLQFLASYAAVFRAPTEKELESPIPSFLYNQDLEAQTTNRIEGVIKGTLPVDSTRFPGTFHYELRGSQEFVNQLIVPYEVFLEEYCRNASKAERTSIAASLDLSFRNGFSIGVGYTYSNYRYKSYAAYVFEQDSTGNIVQRNRDFSGNFVPGMPMHKLTADFSYEHTFASKFSIFAKATYSAMSGLWTDDGNTAKTDFSQLVNSLAGIEFKPGHFDILLSGGVNNILNENYVGWVTVNSADKKFYNAGAPRNYYCSLNFKYAF